MIASRKNYLLIPLAFVVLLSACGMNKLPTAGDASGKALLNSNEGQVAFSRSVASYTQANCVGCHGASQSPLFASADAVSNYNLSKHYVDFTQPISSMFVRRTTDGHCGSACNTDGSAMLDAINTWKNGEEDAGILPVPPPPAQITTTPMTIAAVLPTGNTFVTMSWPLAGYGADYAGALLTLEIQKFDAYSYRVRNPRLKTAANTLAIADLKLILNGSYDPLNGNYVTVNSLVAPNVNAVLSSTTMIVLYGSYGPGVDQIAISIGSLIRQ